MPGLSGADGKIVRWSNIGGQPFVLMTWNTDMQNKEALDFVQVVAVDATSRTSSPSAAARAPSSRSTTIRST